ncbi:hypothetical protein GCM10010923_09690 [Blastomonas marina]|uniref:Small integral membrane protein n=1 Tax=Blastomonas marina TaxID=1867408 RepID=A0ABQ1F8S6_9SPHN|nr:hypothetical protein [Blastomonas marina]GGA02927.1 hypothetical protein GCM10010923_09690 [Blastomonas marina]
MASEKKPVDYTPPSDFTPAECERSWSHALHEENVFNERLNFFLLAQAMLLVFYATAIADVSRWTLVAISACGVVLTVFWLLINIRQAGDLEDAKRRMKKCLPDYAEYCRRSSEERGFYRNLLPVLSHGVPLVVGLIWVALLVEELFPILAR